MSYDPSGRLLSKGMAFSTAGYSVSRTVKQTYLLGGLPDRTSYGDQILSAETTSTMAYDARGLPASVTISTGGGAVPQPPIVETRNVAGLVTKRRVDYSGGLFVTPAMTYAESVWTYDQLGRVTDQTVNRSPGTPIQVARQALTYLDNDDVATLTTYFGATAKSQTFTYDYRHQLTNVESGTPGYFHADYSYGDAGRFTRATVSQTIVPTPAESEVRARDVFYKYEGTDPEQVTSLRTGSLTGPALITYTYDTSGNQVTRTDAGSGYTWTYLYDGADRLRRATKTQAGVIVGSEEYWYDASGARSQVVKRNAGGNISEMVFFIDGTEVHYTAIGGVTHAYAHVAMGTPIARTDRTLSFLSGETIATEYQFHGLAGSTLTTISSTGTINATFNYGPFGEVLETTNDGGASAGTAVHSRRFNDKQQDDLTGLSYYGARYYDRTMLGWTQLDPLYLRIPDLAKQSTPRRSNLGAFSLNNPVRYADPDGRDSAPSGRDSGAAHVCNMDGSGHCTHEGDGAAAYDGENAWLSHTTTRDKALAGIAHANADIGAAGGLAEYNRMKSPRPLMALSWMFKPTMQDMVFAATGHDIGASVVDAGVYAAAATVVHFSGGWLANFGADAYMHFFGDEDGGPVDPEDLVTSGGYPGGTSPGGLAGGGGAGPKEISEADRGLKIKISRELSSTKRVIKAGTDIDKIDVLVDRFGGTRKGWVKYSTTIGPEIHWYEHAGIGKVGVKWAGDDDPF